MKSEIVMTTLNSSYSHTAFGLRYLMANLRHLRDKSSLIEFTIDRSPIDVVAELLAFDPKIIGFGVYIWNTEQTFSVLSLLKKVRPDIKVILGGPEISYETEEQKLFSVCDFVVKGEGDDLFRELCDELLENTPAKHSLHKIVTGALPNVHTMSRPYELYTDEDLKNRYVYVEASRGCPYKCEYCLSSLDKSVRNFPLDQFLADLDLLISRGARQFKFIDRTFNLSPTQSLAILQFFLDRIDLGLFLHFEMVPDRLPFELKEILKKFPRGAVQFEIGIQTFNPQVATNVSRKNDMVKVKENFRFLKEETGIYTHADLIVGLPGEDLVSFGKGFDELISYEPHEIQVGILKRLKGTPIARHEKTFAMIYSDQSPFQILQTKDISFEEIRFMSKFAKFWDLIGNSGNFKTTLQVLKLWNKSPSFFEKFKILTEFLNHRHPNSHSIGLQSLSESVYLFLCNHMNIPEEEATNTVLSDFRQSGRTDKPAFLKRSTPNSAGRANMKSVLPKRQKRQLSNPLP